MIESAFIYLFYTLVKEEGQTFDANRALLFSIFALIVTMFFLLKISRKRKSGKNIRQFKYHTTNDTSDNKEMVGSLEEEFEYAIYEFSEGRRTVFTVQDIDIVAEYIKLKTGKEVFGSFNGKQSLVFETTSKIIIFELLEKQIETLFDDKKRYQIFVNNTPIYHLAEVLNG